jgi:hypothetical protein
MNGTKHQEEISPASETSISKSNKFSKRGDLLEKLGVIEKKLLRNKNKIFPA